MSRLRAAQGRHFPSARTMTHTHVTQDTSEAKPRSGRSAELQLCAAQVCRLAQSWSSALRRPFSICLAPHIQVFGFRKMKVNLTEIPGSIVAPQGFSASGVFCDIKRLGTGKGSDKGQKRDLALIVSQVPAAVAGMFTTNQVCAAPVKICMKRVRMGPARAIVVNSGNANACTGKQGLADALEMVRFTEKALNLAPGSALVGSTGRIGVTLPMDQVRAGIIEAAVELGSKLARAAQAAEAIMTSDTRPKQIAVEFRLGGKAVRIGGICKGAGMIQPGMSPRCMPLCCVFLPRTRRLIPSCFRLLWKAPLLIASIGSRWTAI